MAWWALGCYKRAVNWFGILLSILLILPSAFASNGPKDSEETCEAQLIPPLSQQILAALFPKTPLSKQPTIITYKIPRKNVVIHSVRWVYEDRAPIPYLFDIAVEIPVGEWKGQLEYVRKYLEAGDRLVVLSRNGSKRMILPSGPLYHIGQQLEHWEQDEVEELATQFAMGFETLARHDDDIPVTSRYILLKVTEGLLRNQTFAAAFTQHANPEAMTKVLLHSRYRRNSPTELFFSEWREKLLLQWMTQQKGIL